ncbi:hypothetical protein [Nocardioides terrae]|uniref:hypothetical protein n=1 Tax=Nocardioides terrae TaxID=574651 RepID=UPI0011137D05|nr:hypothetical protein [Nocardioides terrae]
MPYSQTLRFIALQTVGYVVPGTLLWRALRRRTVSWLHDATLGTILAHAITVLVFLGGRAGGLPQVVWVVPVATIGAFLAVPSLRGYWLTPPRHREPAWFTWGIAVGVILICSWFGVYSVKAPIAGPALNLQPVDYAYLLSLAGEVRNHMPPTTPYLVDERLDYHWFTFADVAAMNWQGGQDLDLLLFRLGPLWCVVNAFIAFGLLGARMAGRRSVALVALAIAVLVGSVNLLHGADTYVVDSTLLMVNWMGSPTQGFGQLLAVAVLYVAVGILRGTSDGWRAWLLFGVLSGVLMGAKATFVPVLGAGVALVVVIGLLRNRRVPLPALAMGCVLAVELAFAQIILFGGARQGLTVDPGADMRRLGAMIAVPADSGTLPLVAVSAAIVLGWLAPLAGAALLLLRPRPPAGRPGPSDPATQLVAGMVAAAVAVAVLLAHPGYSQYFFLRSGLPFGYLLVACGLARLDDLGVRRAAGWWLVVAGAGGAAYVGLSRFVTRAPLDEAATARRALLLVVGVLVVAGVAWLLGRRMGRRLHVPGRATLALGCVAVATLGMGTVRAVDIAVTYPAPAFDPVANPIDNGPIPVGGVSAGHFVRDHSGPEDMVATNAHCAAPVGPCNPRTFWISAYTERRIVLEGWGYTATANDAEPDPTAALTLPYWNPRLQALNDAVFTVPSATALKALTDRYPVRWLVVDSRFPVNLAGLRTLLPEHRRFGKVVVFRVRAH